MNTILIPLIQVAYIALDLYLWAIIISVIMSWLVAFNVINTHNRFVYMVGSALSSITEPALRRIRGVLPVMGGIDFSPIILILAVYFVQMVLVQLLAQL
jgi:YggT family protein